MLGANLKKKEFLRITDKKIKALIVLESDFAVLGPRQTVLAGPES